MKYKNNVIFWLLLAIIFLVLILILIIFVLFDNKNSDSGIKGEYYKGLLKKCQNNKERKACCEASVRSMENIDARLLNNKTNKCPDGYEKNMLKCIGSYTWCQKKKNSNNNNSRRSENKENNNVICTQDVKKCPDGSYVRRVGPKCEFESCKRKNDNARNKKDKENNNVICIQDVKKCPDGSYVRRVGPKCEFESCNIGYKNF